MIGWFFMGIVLGLLVGLNLHEDKEARTLEQVDADLRRDLERYKNLSMGLLEDVKYWRDRYNTLHKVKDDK